jgi:CheY-like chemotaxis protein
MAKPQEKRILVVDDDPDVVYFLSAALEDAGFAVDTAFSVDEALACVRAARPDFVSLDMVMPGKSGAVLFHELRRNPAWSKIPVLFVTGKATDEKVRKDLSAALAESSMSGPSTYLEKPVTAARFVQVVSETLGVEVTATAQPAAEPSSAELRDELEELMKQSSADSLKEALKILKHRLGS